MIISRTPYRISFAGGGTDLKSFYEIEQGAVIGTTINKYLYVAVNRPLDESIKINYWKTELVESLEEIEHAIVREALRLTRMTENIEVVSMADIPSGTGLGSSGSFTVGLLNSLYNQNLQPIPAEEMARGACKIEIEMLKAPIGKQDQYFAAYGGLNFIRFNPDETVVVEPILCRKEIKTLLESRLMLFYTGLSRDANKILAKQQERTKEKAKFKLLQEMKTIAFEMRQVLLEGQDLNLFGELLHREWLHKKSLLEEISTPLINQYYEKALMAGAVGGKLSGAGSGGFLLLYCDEEKQPAVRRALSDLKEVEFSFEPKGSSILFVSDQNEKED